MGDSLRRRSQCCALTKGCAAGGPTVRLFGCSGPFERNVAGEDARGEGDDQEGLREGSLDGQLAFLVRRQAQSAGKCRFGLLKPLGIEAELPPDHTVRGTPQQLVEFALVLGAWRGGPALMTKG